MTRATVKYPGLLALVTVLFYWKALLTSQFTLILGSEGVSLTYAWLHFWLNSVWHGHIPLWDPDAFAGRPFPGEMQTAAFYPLRLLFALVPLNRNGLLSPRFFGELAAVTHILSAFFMFAFLRELRRSRFASLIGACAFSMGGVMSGMSGHSVESCIWLPAIFFFLLRALRAGNRGRALVEAAFGGLCLGMSVLAGGTRFSQMQGLVAVTALLWFGGEAVLSTGRPLSFSGLSNNRRIWLSLAAIAGTLLLVAFGTGAVQLFPAWEYARLSVHPGALGNGLMGSGVRPEDLVTVLFPFGFNAITGGNASLSLYGGALPFLLAMVALWRCRKNLWVRYMAGLALLTFLCSLGQLSPLLGFLYSADEPAGRFLYQVSFALATLSAFGMDALLESAGRPELWTSPRRLLKWLAVFCCIILFIAIVFSRAHIPASSRWSLAFIASSCFGFFQFTQRPASSRLRLCLAVFVLLDLFSFHWLEGKRNASLMSGDPYQQMLTLRPAAGFIKSQPGLGRVRVSANPEPNIGDIFGVQSLGGGTLLTDFSRLLGHEDLLNVRYHIKRAYVPDPDPIYKDPYWKVFADPGYPRAWLTHQVLVEPNHENVFRRIDAGSLDLRNVAIVEAPLSATLNPDVQSDSVLFRSYRADSMTLDVATRGTSLLVLSEIYYPGWHVSINGNSATILKVDGALRGIVVPPGASRVELQYTPLSFYSGTGLSFFTVIGVFLFWWRRRTAALLVNDGASPLWLRPDRVASTAASQVPTRLIDIAAKLKRPVRVAQFLLPFALFFALAGDGMTKFFGGDDVMNLYKYLESPMSHWLRGLVYFWSSDFYRPLGGVVYLALFHTFGFHPLPFKLVLFAALTLNMVLFWRVARKLVMSGEPETNLPAAWSIGLLRDSTTSPFQLPCWALLFFCYHAAFDGLYLNFGTIYDVLGYSFFFGAFLAYMKYFTASRSPRLGVPLVIVLYVLGLCCKEIVVTLPVVLLVYNLLISRALSIERLRWPVRSGLPVVVCGAIAVLYTLGKMSGAAALATDAAYAPHFNPAQYAMVTANYLRQLFYLPEGLPTSAAAVTFLALMLALSLLLRSRLMLFSAVSVIVAQLPVSFIAARGAFAIYIPFAFWALYAAALIDAATPLLRKPFASAAAFLAMAAILFSLHLRMKPEFDPNYTTQTVAYGEFSAKLDQWNVHLAETGRVLLVDDPFPPNWIGWDPLFLISDRDHTTRAVVVRMKFATVTPPESEMAWYDYVIGYDKSWHLLKGPGQSVAGAAWLRDVASHAPVNLLDGFYPPSSGNWRSVFPTFALRISPSPGTARLSVSFAASVPVRLLRQLDDQDKTAPITYPAGPIQLDLPIPHAAAGLPHTLRFWMDQDPGGLIFVDAALSQQN